MKSKVCIICLKRKKLIDFYFRKDSNKYRNECKCCFNIKNRNRWNKNNKRYNKLKPQYYIDNKEYFKQKAKEYQTLHKEECKKYSKEYYKVHKNHILKQHKENKESINTRMRKYTKERRKNDLGFRLLLNLRSRLSVAIKLNIKSNKTMKLVGCSMSFLKNHLEKQFKDGMNWENYGRGWNGKGMQEWHIDHIKPCVYFDLSKPEEQYKCFHWSNLQPLWATENYQKKVFKQGEWHK